MSRSFWETYQRARKPHNCDICGLPVLVGEVYLRWAWVDGSDRASAKAHPVCDRQALKASPSGMYQCGRGVDCIDFTAVDVRADAVFNTPDEAAQIERVAAAIEELYKRQKKAEG